MSSPENPWFSPSRLASVLSPSLSASGGLPPKPPDPPDPSLPQPPPSSSEFPPLSPSTSSSPPNSTIPTTVDPKIIFEFSTENLKKSSTTSPPASPVVIDVAMSEPVEETTTTPLTQTGDSTATLNSEPGLTTLPQKNSPILTNKASASSSKPSESTLPQPSLPKSTPPSVPNSNPPPVNPSQKASSQKSPKPKLPHPPVSYASKVKLPSDRSLSRLAPTTLSASGKPQVHIPDAVFERGAALHKEYVVGSFLGKMPDYGPIQSVLNYMWGKGSKLEIHLLPLKHSMLVRVPNEFIRTKVLEKKLWYVDTSMFYVSQWGSNPEESYPEITSIPLWAHLRGVPFDLRTKEGLSLAAGLVGEPIETDDYTKNISSLNIAHVKVEANLQKPLPSCGELVRQNGDIIDVEIDYPWTPPHCTHCNRIGHIEKNCIYQPAPPQEVVATDTTPPSTPSVHLQGYSPHVSMEIEVNAGVPTPPLDPPADLDQDTIPDLPDQDVSHRHEVSPTVPQEDTDLSAVDFELASLATTVVSLPARSDPISSSSYISRKHAAYHNSPIITLPEAFMDKNSPSFIATTNPDLSNPPDLPPPTSVPGSSHISGAPPPLSQ
ncbi:hypothetical protein Rs2_05905 [Raphanus sativus]|nr:hypothetical protein Rs2_05905 [Raphanus sativus]